MKQMRVVIIDDEPIGIEVIRELIVQLAPDLTIAGTASNGLEAVEKITALKPDLVFMDVDMPLLNGYAVIEKLSYRSFYLVFTTGFVSPPPVLINGIASVSLSKPVDPADFLDMVESARKHLKASS